MISAFATTLPQINSEISALDATAVTSPVSVSPPTGSRGWYRLVADWGYSGDGDSRPDWVEFEAGDSDPFNGDTDGDGIPDTGDFDGDGIPDNEDAAIDDRLIDWKTSAGEPHYILIAVDQSNHQDDTIQMMNNWSSVVYSNRLWRFDEEIFLDGIPSSSTFEIPQSDGSIELVDIEFDGSQDIRGLFDSGALVGMAGEIPLGQSGVPIPVFWPSSDAKPKFVGRNLPLWSGGIKPFSISAAATDGHFLVESIEGDIFGYSSLPQIRTISLYGEENQAATPLRQLPLPDFQHATAVMATGKAAVISAYTGGFEPTNFLWIAPTDDYPETFELVVGPSHPFRSLSRTPSGRLLLSEEDSSKTWMLDDNGSWQESSGLHRVTKLSLSGTGITSDGKIWEDGEYLDPKNLCPALRDGGFTQIETLDINEGGVILIQAEKGGSKFQLLANPIQFETPTSWQEDVPFEKTDELKVAKFDGGKKINGGLLYESDRDRFRISMGPLKLKETQKVLFKMGTKHPQNLAFYNDPSQILEVKWDPDEEKFFSKLHFLAAHDIDDQHQQTPLGNGSVDYLKIGADEHINEDPSHKVALGGEVFVDFVKIADTVFTSELVARVKARRTIQVRLINPKKGAGAVAPVAVLETHKKHIIELMAQVGVLATVEIVTNPPTTSGYSKYFNIELPEGEEGNNPAAMTQDEVDLLNNFTDPAQDIFEIVFIENFKEGASANGTPQGTFGISYGADRPIPVRYKNTAIVAVDGLPPNIVAHELGHLLTRAGHIGPTANLMDALAAGEMPDGEEAYDARRLSQQQENTIYTHPAVKKIEE